MNKTKEGCIHKGSGSLFCETGVVRNGGRGSTITYWFSDQAIRQPDGHVSGVASGIASGIASEPVNYLSEKGLKLVK